MVKYEYEPGLCKQLHYNDADCEVFKNLPEVKPADQEWHMRDER